MRKYKETCIIMSLLYLGMSFFLPFIRFTFGSISLASILLEFHRILTSEIPLSLFIIQILSFAWSICVLIWFIRQKEFSKPWKPLLLIFSLILVKCIVTWIIWPVFEISYQVAYGTYLCLIFLLIWFILIIKVPFSNSSSKQFPITLSKPIENDKTSMQTSSLKEWEKFLFLVNILLFTSIFLVWDSRVDKVTGMMLFLTGNGFWDWLSRLVLLLSLHIILSDLLYFTNPSFFLPATLINHILYWLLWIRGCVLIRFVNMAAAPLFGLAFSLFSVALTFLLILKNPNRSTLRIELTEHTKGYLLLLKNGALGMVKTIRWMIHRWKEH